MNSEHLFKFNNLLIALWLLFPFITSDVTACSELVNQKRLIFAPYNSCETVLAFSFLKVLPQISDIFDFFIGYEGVGQNLDKLLEKHYEFSKIMENKHGVAFWNIDNQNTIFLKEAFLSSNRGIKVDALHKSLDCFTRNRGGNFFKIV